MNLSGYVNLELSSKKLRVQKAEDRRTQLLFGDILYASVIANTADLLEYLESLTEQVRLIDCEQNLKEL